MRVFSLLIVLALACYGLTPLERLETAHLEAVHAQRVEWMKKRAATHPPPGVYQDFRAVVGVHAADAEVLRAAREDDVQVVMVTGHDASKRDSEMRGGVLFLHGSEDDHELRLPSLDLRFLSPGQDGAEGVQGMEIYAAHPKFQQYIQPALKNPREWRRLVENEKLYPDEVLAAITDPVTASLERWDHQIALHPLTGIAANEGDASQVFKGVTFDPYTVAFRQTSTHILARELNQKEIRDSLQHGHVYVAHDWLCDPRGFLFIAENNLGVFDMGDPVPMMNPTRLSATLPVAAKIRLIHNGAIIAEANGSAFRFTVQEQGAYRLEAWLTVDGEDRPWIYSNPIYIGKPPDLTLPRAEMSPEVEVHKGIPYVNDDLAKHRLDVYVPAGQKNFPVMMFLHGGSWRSGDRSVYPPFGVRFAKAGIGVVIPSYRLMPKYGHPAQIEDAAAAFAWAHQNIAKFGGDPQRIYVAGHSAGGHLAALLAADPKYLAKYDLAGTIRGVVSMSGVYDVKNVAAFQAADDDPSPIDHVHARMPPFLITYCQWDYFGLPEQAREFVEALKGQFVSSTVVYIPGESHVSEIVDTLKDDDPSARAILNFVK